MKQAIKLWMLAAILAICGATATRAQIDPQVSEILRKSQQAMTNPKGIEITMTVDVKMMVKLSGSTMVVSQKGNKERAKVTMKVVGKVMNIDTGFDGTQKWRYKHVPLTGKEQKKGEAEKKDTLTIEKMTKKPKSESNIDFDLDKDYKTATMKLSGRYYEITFTNPVNKDDPKKATMKIDKDKYYVREIKAKQSVATVTMTVTKIKFGVNDDVFKLNLNDYPGAVVVRK